MIEVETFVEIEGFENYEVSNLGKVRNIKSGRVLKTSLNNNGYLRLFLCENNKRKHLYLHRIIATAFIDNPGEKPCVNHIDGNKSNNFVGNLEWISRKGNTQHAIATGLRADSNMRGRTGSLNPLSKPVAQYTKSGDFMKVWSGYSEAARAYGCKPCTIINCAKGRIKSCKGFVWKEV